MNRNDRHMLPAAETATQTTSVPPVPEFTEDEIIDMAAVRILQQYREAFEELAK